jgi:hypothetical protein
MFSAKFNIRGCEVNSADPACLKPICSFAFTPQMSRQWRIKHKHDFLTNNKAAVQVSRWILAFIPLGQIIWRKKERAHRHG